jgi:hypothetical protein
MTQALVRSGEPSWARVSKRVGHHQQSEPADVVLMGSGGLLSDQVDITTIMGFARSD